MNAETPGQPHTPKPHHPVADNAVAMGGGDVTHTTETHKDASHGHHVAGGAAPHAGGHQAGHDVAHAPVDVKVKATETHKAEVGPVTAPVHSTHSPVAAAQPEAKAAGGHAVTNVHVQTPAAAPLAPSPLAAAAHAPATHPAPAPAAAHPAPVVATDKAQAHVTHAPVTTPVTVKVDCGDTKTHAAPAGHTVPSTLAGPCQVCASSKGATVSGPAA
jgi:hypothetical protein